MTRNVEEILSQGVLESDDEEDEVNGVSDEELDELEQGMTAAGFSPEEISSILTLVKDTGSMDAALDVLKGIGNIIGIDWDDFVD